MGNKNDMQQTWGRIDIYQLGGDNGYVDQQSVIGGQLEYAAITEKNGVGQYGVFFKGDANNNHIDRVHAVMNAESGGGAEIGKGGVRNQK